MTRTAVLISAMLMLSCFEVRAALKQSTCAPPIAPGKETWSFAVSGDSRNCGDLVMPAIAKSILAPDHSKVDFYWHLGDFRSMSDVDRDMRDDSDLDSHEEKEKVYCSTGQCLDDYQSRAWDDFIQKQLRPFGQLPVFLGIGNHELFKNIGLPKSAEDRASEIKDAFSRARFLQAFSAWVDSPLLRQQRCGKSVFDCPPRTYYHWNWKQVDFISLDNAGENGFDQNQLEWLKHRLEADSRKLAIRTVVVGMHRALPNSWACAHSMNGNSGREVKASIDSGRSAYLALLDFRNSTGKHVYVLASHSHFVMTDVFETPYWHGWQRRNGKGDQVLCGMIVGTAGAHRYPTPAVTSRKVSVDDRREYGYFLATVSSDGTIGFDFHPIGKDDIREAVTGPSQKLIEWCVDRNGDDDRKKLPLSCDESP